MGNSSCRQCGYIWVILSVLASIGYIVAFSVYVWAPFVAGIVLWPIIGTMILFSIRKCKKKAVQGYNIRFQKIKEEVGIINIKSEHLKWSTTKLKEVKSENCWKSQVILQRTSTPSQQPLVVNAKENNKLPCYEKVDELFVSYDHIDDQEEQI